MQSPQSVSQEGTRSNKSNIKGNRNYLAFEQHIAQRCVLQVFFPVDLLKFIYSEKATRFCEIFPLLLTTVHTVKCKGKISQNFVAFSEYMNFTMVVINPPEKKLENCTSVHCGISPSQSFSFNLIFLDSFEINKQGVALFTGFTPNLFREY